MSAPVLPRVGDVLDLGPTDWSFREGCMVIPGDRPVRLAVHGVRAATAAAYLNRRCWIFATELDDSGTPVRPVHALVSTEGDDRHV